MSYPHTNASSLLSYTNMGHATLRTDTVYRRQRFLYNTYQANHEHDATHDAEIDVIRFYTSTCYSDVSPA